MTLKEVKEVVEELRASGASDEDFLEAFYQMFQDDQIDLDELGRLVQVIGYELSEEFLAMSPEDQKTKGIEYAEEEINLDEERKKIEEIDEQMAELFVKRMQASKNIAKYKKDNNLPIFDKQREIFLIEKNSNYIKDEELKKYYQEFLESVITISKKYQKEKIK